MIIGKAKIGTCDICQIVIRGQEIALRVLVICALYIPACNSGETRQAIIFRSEVHAIWLGRTYAVIPEIIVKILLFLIVIGSGDGTIQFVISHQNAALKIFQIYVAFDLL